MTGEKAMSDKAHDGWQMTVFLCVIIMTIGSCTAYASHAPQYSCGELKEETK